MRVQEAHPVTTFSYSASEARLTRAPSWPTRDARRFQSASRTALHRQIRLDPMFSQHGDHASPPIVEVVGRAAMENRPLGSEQLCPAWESVRSSGRGDVAGPVEASQVEATICRLSETTHERLRSNDRADASSEADPISADTFARSFKNFFELALFVHGNER